jgi:hypothetical protein
LEAVHDAGDSREALSFQELHDPKLGNWDMKKWLVDMG